MNEVDSDDVDDDDDDGPCVLQNCRRAQASGLGIDGGESSIKDVTSGGVTL